MESPKLEFNIIWLKLGSFYLHLIDRNLETKLPEAPWSAANSAVTDPKHLPRGHHICFSISNFESFVQTLKTGQTVSIKRIRVGKQQKGVNFTALSEIKLLKELKDPYIIELVDTFQHKDNLNLVFQFMEIDLEAVIRDRNIFLSLADIKSYLQMTLQGLAICHKKWVLHRDMKRNNNLLI